MSASYCLGDQVTTCPPDIDSCPRLLSVAQDGAVCRRWQTDNPAERTVAMKRYCTLHPDARECLCINRASDGLYSRLRPSRHTDDQVDAHWWKPCYRDGEKYLVPDSVQRQPLLTYDQSQKVTRTVNRNFQRQGVYDREYASRYVNANLNANKTTWWDTYKWWIFGVILFIILVIILIVIVYVIRKKSTSADKAKQI